MVHIIEINEFLFNKQMLTGVVEASRSWWSFHYDSGTNNSEWNSSYQIIYLSLKTAIKNKLLC